ncbi:MAG: hypothetical protein G01um10148_460 [Parcubacteria group bacterium Gr01-1014_8]|nr:MAG: hypothetical protein G01um10148_460 [Parcubacteria group bacterium Gr01-1014_8]
MTRQIEFASDEIYHVYNRGTEKRSIFSSRGDYERFLTLLYSCNQEERLDERLSRYSLREALELPRGSPLVDVAAYCLMPNHFHLILREIGVGGISKFMQKVITGYTMYFNKRHERNGALLQGKFKAVHAKDDRYLKYLIAYVHLNPVALTKTFEKETLSALANLKSLERYPYSSYLDFSGVERPENKLIDAKAMPEYFSTPSEFKKHINEWLAYKLNTD